MRVHNHHTWRNLITTDDITMRNLCQHPHLTPTLQRTCGFVSHTLTRRSSELECFFILHHFVAVRHDTEGRIVGVAGVGLVAGDDRTVFGIDILLIHRPIQVGIEQCIRRGGGALDLGIKIMPGLLSHIKVE